MLELLAESRVKFQNGWTRGDRRQLGFGAQRCKPTAGPKYLCFNPQDPPSNTPNFSSLQKVSAAWVPSLCIIWQVSKYSISMWSLQGKRGCHFLPFPEWVLNFHYSNQDPVSRWLFLCWLIPTLWVSSLEGTFWPTIYQN